MARKDPGPKADRRRFLTGSSRRVPHRDDACAFGRRRGTGAARALGSAASERPLRRDRTPRELARVKGIPGSDFMVDVIKTLGIKYLPANCASATAPSTSR